MDTLTYIDIHLVTLIMSYESVDIHAGFYTPAPNLHSRNFMKEI